MARKDDDLELIFRRYRTLPDGTVLDAYKYGLRAWPLWVPRQSK